MSLARSLSYIWAPQQRRTTRTAAELPARGRYTAGFVLFVILNAVLFIRPSELFPGLEGWPIFNVVILACIAASFPALIRQLKWKYLRSQPTILCALALLPVIAISLKLNHQTVGTVIDAIESFSKVLIYFFLLTALVNTPQRIVQLLRMIMIFIVAIAMLAELSYHHVINLESIHTIDRAVGADVEADGSTTVEQLYGPGIFADPNDFALILAVGVVLILYRAIESKNQLSRFGYLAVMVIPGYAFALTRSRGGFLSLGAGVTMLAIGRFGWKRSIPLLAAAVPVMLILFSGRMTDINVNSDDTAAGRMMLWREGFALLKHEPIFGIGYDCYADQVGHVAHNSYVHAFTELGLVGGILFCGMLYTPITVLRRPLDISSHEEQILNRWRPALLAVMAGYAVGMCSLSRCYEMSTYVIIGAGAAYAAVLAKYRPENVPMMTQAYVKRLAIVGLCVIVFFNIVVRIL